MKQPQQRQQQQSRDNLDDELQIVTAESAPQPGGSSSSASSSKAVAQRGWEDDSWTNYATPEASSSRHATSSARSTATGPGPAAEGSRAKEPRQSANAWDTAWGEQGKSWDEIVMSGGAPSSAQHLEHTDLDKEDDRGPTPDVGNDGRWTTPRVLACAEENGGKPGIWEHSVWDFDVRDTPVPDKAAKSPYRAMGEWVDAAPKPEQVAASESTTASPSSSTAMGPPSSDVAMQDDTASSTPTPAAPLSDSSAPPPPPRKGFRTITRAELDAIRPHPHLYFCRHTLSWCLLAPLPSQPPSALRPAPPGTPELWQFGGLGGLSAKQLLHSGEHLSPPLPAAIRPAQIEAFTSETTHRPFKPTLRDVVGLNGVNGGHVVFSSQTFFPPVIPTDLWSRLLDARGNAPTPGQSRHEAQFKSVHTIWRVVDDALFKGETRAVPIMGKTFSRVMPMDSITHDVFLAVLGYRAVGGGTALSPPSIDDRTDEGRENRARLLRCWLELGLWLEDYQKRYPPEGTAKRDFRVVLKPGKPALTAAMGGDDLARIDPNQGWTTVSRSASTRFSPMDPLADEYSRLGCTPDLADETIVTVYDAQTEAWAPNIPSFLEALSQIANARASDTLKTKVAIEHSKGRHTRSELDRAYAELRLPSGVNGDDLTEDQICDAFHVRDPEVTHPERKKVLREAMEVIAGARGSDLIKAMLVSMGDGDETASKPKMDVERAYKVLEVDVTTDDDMLVTVYGFRLDDAPLQKDKMREALEAIAEARNSDKLRAFLRSGNTDSIDGWQAGPAVDTNLPVGLTNIANTCYLNSLLQYFFTVRELRETILQFTTASVTHPDEQIRVGGRLVSKAEVERSQRFVSLLQALFYKLIHAPVSAVTPETELAYLALVPSREEAEAFAAKKAEKGEKPAELPSPDLIILDGPDLPAPTASPEEQKSPSILGKRKNSDANIDPMLIDTPVASAPRSALGEKDLNRTADTDMADAPSPTSPHFIGSSDERSIKRGRSVEHAQAQAEDLTATEAPDGVVEIAPVASTSTLSEPAKVEPPPLPPRRPEPERAQTKDEQMELQVSNYMAFGRQNDVTECMDNVMFQVEAALQANAVNGAAEEAGSLLKRTFYGLMRQKLVLDDPSTPDPIRTQEEPFFSLLVDVPPSSVDRDIYDGLDTVFDDAPVEIEGKSARRRISLVDVPPILQIQLQRVQYDREKQRIYKSNAHLTYPETIRMDRYLEVDETDAGAIEKRERTNEKRELLEKTKARLAELTADKNVNQSQQLKDTLSHLLERASEFADLVTPELAEETAMEANDLESEISALRQRVVELRSEIEQIWERGEKAPYELVSVFIHRGTASSGHYFIYQRDSRNPRRWLKYNDSLITEVDRDEIFRETTGDTNGYFLVYCRKDRLDAIESIKREV
ncbi:hypothetical protein JCM1840_002542 [Sporobolomyces johnsonii]